ncbi:MAG TPA: choice-of-anchor D domain-containing protein [Friedmanniella sp.]
MRAHRRPRSFAIVLLVGLLTADLVGAAPATADVTTISFDALRTGWDSHEPRLGPSDVGAQDFGQLFATQLDGQVYAQPVVARNTLMVVTEADKAYGLDPVTGAVRWTRNVGPAWSVAALGCGDLVPQVGITATPTVDPATGTAYFTAKVDDAANPDHPRWEMHAVDITTGAERPHFPTVIAGSPDNDPSGTFSSRTAMQRPGLLLLGGVVYAGFASHCDQQPYVGYVVGVDAASGRRTSMWATETGNAKAGAGIWQSGGGLVSDGAGRIIVATGNGISPHPGPGSPTPTTLGESVIRLQVQPDRTLKAVDYFSPVNNTNLDTDDTDLGSGAPLALPDGFGTAGHPHLLVEVGKDGRVFLLDRDHLGGTGQGAGGTDDVLQVNGPYRGVWGHPAFWGGSGGYVYLVPNGGPLSAFKVGVSGAGGPVLTRTGVSVGAFGYTSGSPVVTSNGSDATSALVWTVYAGGPTGVGGQLRAYDATPVKGTMTLRYSVPIGTATKFAVPATDAGRVYVANRTGQVYGFGRPTTSALAGNPSDFAKVAVGSAATRQVVVTATKPLTVTQVATGDGFSPGAVTLPTRLAAGATLTVPVTFAPTSPGAASGALSFTTSAGTFAFDLHGFGTQPGLTSDPPSLDFGDVPVRARVTLSVSVSNSGAGTTTVTGTSGPTGPFATSSLPASGTSLASGGSVSVPVTFAPTTAGTTTSRVVVRSSTGDVTVPVTGRGVEGAPRLALTPTEVDFGDVEVGDSATKTFDIANTGNLLLTLSKAAPPTAPFLVPDPVAEGQQIEPGDDDAIHQSVTFHPTATGTFSGTYLITGNDGRGAQEVGFTGYGVVAPHRGALSRSDGTCVAAQAGGTADGTAVQLQTCDASAAQLWVLPGDGTARFKNRCLDTVGGGTAAHTPVVIMGCDGGPSQHWTHRGGSAHALVNAASGQCLDVPGNHPVAKVQLQIYPCNWTAAQSWVLPTT